MKAVQGKKIDPLHRLLQVDAFPVAAFQKWRNMPTDHG